MYTNGKKNGDLRLRFENLSATSVRDIRELMQDSYSPSDIGDILFMVTTGRYPENRDDGYLNAIAAALDKKLSGEVLILDNKEPVVVESTDRKEIYEIDKHNYGEGTSAAIDAEMRKRQATDEEDWN